MPCYGNTLGTGAYTPFSLIPLSAKHAKQTSRITSVDQASGIVQIYRRRTEVGIIGNTRQFSDILERDLLKDSWATAQVLLRVRRIALFAGPGK
jgi:hypothetical protein